MLTQRLEGMPILGKGLTSDVYAGEEGRVLKLFHTGRQAAKVEREYRITCSIHAAGLPVPAAYELIDVGGRHGIVFERVHGVSIFNQVQARPWTLFSAVKFFAELHDHIHTFVAPADLPSQRQWIADGIDAANGVIEVQKDEARHRLEALPDGNVICHGDFHPDNVLITSRGPKIIDWSTATRGHPLGDVACTSRLIQSASLPPWAALHAHLLLKFSRAFVHRTYLKRYLEVYPASRREIDAWQDALSIARPIPEW